MKKALIYSLALLAGATFASSCSDDDPKGPSISEKVYTAETLDLTFSGEPMEGKSVKYVPNGDAATLTLYSEFDLSLIPNAGLTENIAGPGVVPGSVQTTLDVELVADGDHYNFAGTGANDYCTFSYSGNVKEEKMELQISDVKLKDLSLTGKWMPRLEMGDDGWGGQEVTFNPIRLAWDSTKGIELFPGIELSMSDILTIVSALPILPDPSDAEASMPLWLGLTRALKQLDFQDDSNIVCQYVEGGLADGPVATSPLNICNYVVNANNTLNLYLNPQAIMKLELEKAEQETKAIGSDNLVSIVELLMSRVAPMLSAGVPLGYELDGDNLSVYVPTDVLLPLLKELVLPIVSDPETVASIVEMVKADESMADYADIVKSALNSMPEIINNTTKLEAGINLTRVK